MQSTLENVLAIDSELEKVYKDILIKAKVNEMDALVFEFNEAITSTKGQLSNETIRHFSGMFGFYAYSLNASLSRHGMRSDVAEFYLDHQSAKSYVGNDTSVTKMTREDKQAKAKLDTEQEAKVSILLTRVTQAMETRIKAFNKLMETLNMFSAMNMSEAKLEGRK